MMWSDKRYHSLNHYLRYTFEEKIIKIPINAGFTCPNRDGTKGYDGCIFCSEKGSGDFALSSENSIGEQINAGKLKMSAKWKTGKHAAYFQAFTNTYAHIDHLAQIYSEALKREDIYALFIATRSDCINDDVVLLLKRLKKQYDKPIFVELGLQTSKESTAILINRKFDNLDFENACKALNEVEIDVICHIILGLPFETKEDMLRSCKYACENQIAGIKLQLLYVLEDTKLAKMFLDDEFETLEFDEYIDIIISCLEIIPKDVVIHRLTGDADKNILISPKWSQDKRKVLNTIDQELKKRNTFQGRLF